jgi:hypothetical protein
VGETRNTYRILVEMETRNPCGIMAGEVLINRALVKNKKMEG